jgi:hypothetical protein
MPDYQFVPVDHDPFTGFEPVDHDPFASPASGRVRTNSPVFKEAQYAPLAADARAPRERMQDAYDAAAENQRRWGEKRSTGEQILDIAGKTATGAGMAARGLVEPVIDLARKSHDNLYGGPNAIPQPPMTDETYGDPKAEAAYAEALKRYHGETFMDALGLAAPGIAGAERGALGMAGGKPSFTAYHASPHDLDALDLSKTNQGVWFAKDPGAASRYTSGAKNIYTVDINAPIESLIDRSKPIAHQSESVRNAIAGIENDLGMPRRKDADGATFYADLARKLAGNEPFLQGLVKANDLLRERGIPGISHDDAHVIFDDKLLNITHKNGVPAGGTPASAERGTVGALGGKPGIAASLGERLGAAASDRALFDPILKEAGTASVADLKTAIRELTGYDDMGSRTRADLIKRIHNWQREAELNADISAAQAKNMPMLRRGTELGRTGEPRARIGEAGREIRRGPPLDPETDQAILDAGYERATGTQGPRVVADRRARDAILRRNWETHGAEMDFDDVPAKTWDMEEKKWNADHPENQVGDNIPGHHPFMGYIENKYLNGQRAPYPGVQRANEYFANDGRHELTAYGSLRQIPEEVRPAKRQPMAREVPAERGTAGALIERAPESEPAPSERGAVSDLDREMLEQGLGRAAERRANDLPPLASLPLSTDALMSPKLLREHLAVGAERKSQASSNAVEAENADLESRVQSWRNAFAARGEEIPMWLQTDPRHAVEQARHFMTEEGGRYVWLPEWFKEMYRGRARGESSGVTFHPVDHDPFAKK